MHDAIQHKIADFDHVIRAHDLTITALFTNFYDTVEQEVRDNITSPLQDEMQRLLLQWSADANRLDL